MKYSDEKLVLKGYDKFTAVHTFRKMEEITGTVRVDLSLVSLISQGPDHMGLYLDGENRWEFSKGKVSLLARPVKIGFDPGNDHPILVNGALYKDIVTGKEEEVFALSSFLYKQILQYFHLEHAGSGLLLDHSLAKCCADLIREKNVYIRYRIEDGIKTGIAMFSREETSMALTYDQVFAAVRTSNSLNRTRYEVTGWEIKQRKRQVTFSDKGHSMTFVWSDADFLKPYVLLNGEKIILESQDPLTCRYSIRERAEVIVA